MANAFVQQKAAQATSSVTSFTTSAMTVTAGHAISVCSSINGADTGIMTVTDSQGDTYGTQALAVNTGCRVQWSLSTNVVGGSTTFTVTSASAGFLAICAHQHSGVALIPVESDAERIGEGGIDQIPTSGLISPPSAGDLYLSAWTHGGSGNETFTPNTGWTLRSNLTLTANMPLGSEELIGSGSQTGSVTLSGSAKPDWACVAMALRAADVAAPDDGANPNFVATDFPMTNRGFGDPG